MHIKTLTVGPVQTNCYLVVCEETRRAAVIDPGWDAAHILAAVEALRATVTAILLTHAHFDHIGALADLVDATHAPVALHPLDLPLLRLDGGARWFSIPMRPAPDPDIALEHGQSVEVGALRFEARFAPGHTPGHVVFYLEREQAVFDGDVLFHGSIGRTDFPGGDFDTLIASIRNQLLTLPDEVTVYPGHGPATTIGDERLNNPFL
ncbi:MAG TPA: MBL fold metallo-hydrolase [Anaerolineae bacterium]|nr:MBL fold metallo-hydrolase [Anaerolineae bacterium]